MRLRPEDLAKESRMIGKAKRAKWMLVALMAAGAVGARADIPDDTRAVQLNVLIQELRERPSRLLPRELIELARLPREQREQMREQMREEWRRNPPENIESARPPRPATPISQEERYRLREEMRDQRGRGRRGGWY